MKWNGTKTKLACTKLPLVELLQDQLDEATTAKVVAHLDRCEHCQRRLTEISADADWWREAAVWLENAALDDLDDEPDLFNEFDEPHGPAADDLLIQSGLMEKSSKPEMIGVIGRYNIRRIIGTGGTGIVLQAVDSELDRVVALKVLSPALASNGMARRRFSREGQSAASVVHDNVVAVHHVESNGPVPYLVMQYVEGSSLQELVMRSGPIDVTSALRIIAQLAAALDAAHAQGLVHRDVKPANILVGTAGQRVWITDFGLARAVDDANLTRTGFIAGTPHYMSPEQARGESVSAMSDLFGLGSVLYFALTGRPPFRADRSLAILNRICHEKHRSVREVNPDISPAVELIVDRLLEKKPRARFQSAEEVRQECLRVLNQTKELSPEPDITLPTRSGSRRLKLLTATTVAVLAIGLLVLGWFGQDINKVVAFAATTSTLIEQNTDRLFEPNASLRNEAGRRNEQASQFYEQKNVQMPPFNRRYKNKSAAYQQPPAMQPESNLSALPYLAPPTNLETPLVNSVAQETPINENDLWQYEFYELLQEVDSTNDQWQSSQVTLSPSFHWNNYEFDQQLNEAEAILHELEKPYGDYSENGPSPYREMVIQ